MFFSDARAPFLEFLRNLTPQILLFAMALVMRGKISEQPANEKPIFLWIFFFSFIFTFLAANIANMAMFFEKACVASSFNKKESQRLSEEGVHGFTHMARLFSALWKESKLAFVEVVFVGIVIELSFLAVVIAAVPTASNVLAAMEHKPAAKTVCPKP